MIWLAQFDYLEESTIHKKSNFKIFASLWKPVVFLLKTFTKPLALKLADC